MFLHLFEAASVAVAVQGEAEKELLTRYRYCLGFRVEYEKIP